MAKPKKSAASKKGAGKSSKKVKKASIAVGRAYIAATFNNTKVYITDHAGNLVCWSSAGAKGFKGSRKSTPFAAQEAAKTAADYARENFNMREVSIFINGPGPGREAAAKALGVVLRVKEINDVTGIPHNGCRAEKERRV